ncbi:MAG: hypothetical protein KDA53_01905 [Hyphomonas sp.]|nr:hypothetical protein [Hyphomonas sp.]
MPDQTQFTPVSRASAILLAFVAFSSVIVWSFVSGRFGHVGPDGDDVMRLVQIRDLLAGQGWFDLHQYRLGPEGGVLMHWSRIPEIPILVLYGLFDVFLPSETALMWAISVWPPLSMLIVFWGLWLAARNLGDGRVLVFMMIVALAPLFVHFRFLSGAIDHHNLQIALLAVALGAGLDAAMRRGQMAIAGVALGLSVAIGAETYPFVGVFCAFYALDWALRGQAARKGAVAFGLAFAGSVALCFLATVPPARWGETWTDTLSLISLAGAVAGGAGLAVAAQAVSGRELRIRVAALGGVGVALAILVLVLAPHALSNPLSQLPAEVRTLWLGNVAEARGMFAPADDRTQFAFFALGTSVAGLAVSLLAINGGRQVRAHLLIAPLLALSILLMVYQVRFYVFGHLIAIVPLALWCAHVFSEGRAGRTSSVAYLLAIAVANPALWVLPAALIAPAPAEAGGHEAGACLSEEMLAQLNSEPPATILASENMGAALLEATHHRALSGNYHRDAAGIAAALAAFGAAPDAAEDLVREADVGLVLYCPGLPGTDILARQRPDGFLARLDAGDAPGWLQPVSEEGTIPGGGRLYRVQPARSGPAGTPAT